jgi:hypothetical protein
MCYRLRRKQKRLPTSIGSKTQKINGPTGDDVLIMNTEIHDFLASLLV